MHFLRTQSHWPAMLIASIMLIGGTARAGSAVTESQLETFLGLQQDDLTGLNNGPVQNGSALQFTFTATAPTTLGFDYNFLTNEPPATGLNAINPFAFITAPSLTDIADTFSTLGSSSTPFAMETGYSTYTQTFGAGTFTIGIGVANVTDNLYSSALLLDNFFLTSNTGTIVNGSFESGNFSGFSTIGNASIVTSSFGAGPTDGRFQALLSTSAVPEPSSIVLILFGGLGAFVAAGRRRAQWNSSMS
jgi:hypothetical protein